MGGPSHPAPLSHAENLLYPPGENRESDITICHTVYSMCGKHRLNFHPDWMMVLSYCVFPVPSSRNSKYSWQIAYHCVQAWTIIMPVKVGRNWKTYPGVTAALCFVVNDKNPVCCHDCSTSQQQKKLHSLTSPDLLIPLTKDPVDLIRALEGVCSSTRPENGRLPVGFRVVYIDVAHEAAKFQTHTLNIVQRLRVWNFAGGAAEPFSNKCLELQTWKADSHGRVCQISRVFKLSKALKSCFLFHSESRWHQIARLNETHNFHSETSWNMSVSDSKSVLHGETQKFTMPPGSRPLMKAHSFQCIPRSTP